MVNFRLLFTLIDSRSVQTYLAVVAILGIGVLLDILLLLKLAVTAGPWITMAGLAFLTALSVVFTYRIVALRGGSLVQSIDTGENREDQFTRYVMALIAGSFLILPGVVNTAIGILMLIRPFSTYLGDKFVRFAGIDWSEAYEYMRLNRAAGGTE